MIGILALQGGVREHAKMLEDLGQDVLLVKKAEQLTHIDALVLPGGESSTIDRILRRFDMREALIERLRQIPVLGTCAGLIMLAKHVVNPAPGQETLGILDIDVRRNAFGPQRDSAVEKIDTVYGEVSAAFIRAPEIVRITRATDDSALQPIASVDGKIVGVAGPKAIGISFHPELTGDQTIHREFLKLI